MKRIFAKIVMLTMGLVSALTEMSVANVTINATNFPDENFRNFITSNIDANGNGVLSDAEIAGTTQMYISGKDISNLKGIEFFTALGDLHCNGNNLTSMDVSKNTKLTFLYCFNNQLTSLDVSKNTALEYLYCSNNQLATLDVTKNTALKTLDCESNQLATLNVLKNTVLEHLSCSNNQLTTLDVTKNTALKTLNCESNQLTKLDVSKNTALTTLVCKDNALSSIDVTKNLELLSLNCSGTQLSTLDVSKNSKLTSLYCGNNALTKLDVSKSTNLQELECDNNQLTSINVTKNTVLTSLCCQQNRLSSIDVSKNTKLTKLDVSNNQLTTVDVTKNTALSYLKVSDNQLTSINLSKNVNLMYAYCQNNQLTTLDVSKNTQLYLLDCKNNQLTNLKMADQLENLYCSDNQLTSFVAPKGLILVICDGNNLASLDLSKATGVKSVYCADNQLTALDVSTNTELKTLSCYINQIFGTAMDDLIASLPIRADNDGKLFATDKKSKAEMNTLSEEQVAAALAKGWTATYVRADVEYPLRVGGSKVVSSQRNNIPVDAGSATYDPATKTLTLDNVSITTNYNDVYCIKNEGVERLQIVVKGRCKLHSNAAAIVAESSPLIIMGSGKLEVVSVYEEGIRLAYGVCMKIEDADVTIKGAGAIMGDDDNRAGDITIKNSTLYADSDVGATGTRPMTISGIRSFRLVDCNYTLHEDNSSYNPAYFWYYNGYVSYDDVKYYGVIYITPDEDVATDIAQPQAASQPTDAIYNLQGQRVEKPTRGIYIKNGRKVIVR
ncbi:MAG: leucine-rich repeat domain-containing protein [Prevotella sp.]|nr:leucine-rich repeat domain-containing protein [Prevotella sp.]